MLNVTSPISIDDIAMQILRRAQDGDLKRTHYWHGATWEFNPFQPRHLFDEEFRKDPVAAQRDFGADPPAAESPLIDQPLRFWTGVHYDREPIATFNYTNITDTTGKQYVGVELDRLDYEFDNQYYIFADAGVSFDSFALVCGHPELKEADEYTKEVPRPLRLPNQGAFDKGVHITSLPSAADSPRVKGLAMVGGKPFYPDPESLDRLNTVVDFCVRVVPTQTREIYFNSIVDLIRDLSKKINIAGVWFDSWNSESAIQNIRSMGIPASKYRLTVGDFLSFRAQAYNDQISMLPPRLDDGFNLSANGTVQMKKNEEEMSGEAVCLLETLRLERSTDLKKIVQPSLKGKIRGRGSDDLSRCMIGLNTVIKKSVANEPAGAKAQRLQRQQMTGNRGGYYLPGQK